MLAKNYFLITFVVQRKLGHKIAEPLVEISTVLTYIQSEDVFGAISHNVKPLPGSELCCLFTFLYDMYRLLMKEIY